MAVAGVAVAVAVVVPVAVVVVAVAVVVVVAVVVAAVVVAATDQVLVGTVAGAHHTVPTSWDYYTELENMSLEWALG